MDLGPWFLFLHILGAIVAFGPTFTFPIIGAMGGREPMHANFATRISYRISERVVLPLAIPGILVVATLAFIDGWNSFSLPLILIPKDTAQPYTVALQKYIQEIGYGINWPLLAAGSLVALVPVLTVFAILQRRLVRVGGLGGAIRG